MNEWSEGPEKSRSHCLPIILLSIQNGQGILYISLRRMIVKIPVKVTIVVLKPKIGSA